MKTQFTILSALCAVGFLFSRCNNGSTSTSASNDSASGNTNMYAGYASQAEWGKHLVATGGCNDCHTPKKMSDKGPADDMDLMLSGHPSQLPAPALLPGQLKKGLAATQDLTAWNGPWGTSYSANLTPDSTGIGAWTEQQFITCIRQDVFKGIAGSRPLMPPMPVAGVNNYTDDELKAIFAFLKTIKPIHNVVPDYQPPVAASKNQP
ncbi:MAG: c-type cytochrome [Parafilimonas sp.]|nr:c-type cytochrome [Parafilimonas sp.]